MIHSLNPLTDPRWADLVSHHPSGTVFHSVPWLAALRRTYDYEPLVLTTCPPGAGLTNGVVLCRVKSAFTGTRYVSLPFSDHCDPLAGSGPEMAQLLQALDLWNPGSSYRYVELRPRRTVLPAQSTFSPGSAYFFHWLPVPRSPSEAYELFDKDCVQRKIRRAEREGLQYQEGQSQKLIEEFHHLLTITRRRHRVLPQPRKWFTAVAELLRTRMKIRVAYQAQQPIAGIVTLQFKDALVFKYGASDPARHNLGGVQMLLWAAVQEAIGAGLGEVDFGRTDIDNEGLMRFKDRWGARRSLITYWRRPATVAVSSGAWNSSVGRCLFGHLPLRLASVAGSLVYRHLG